MDQGNSGGTGISYLIISTNRKLSTELFKYCVYIPVDPTTTTTTTSTDTTGTDTTETTTETTDTTTSSSTDTVKGN